MNAFFRQSLVVAALGLAGATSMAQDFRIGFVNTDRIFRESNPAKLDQARGSSPSAKRAGSQRKTATEV